MFLFAILLVGALLAYYVQRNRTYWSRRNVAGPSPIPFCGNMINYLRQKQHYGEVYHDIYTAYPDVPYVGVYKVMNQPAVLIKDLDLIKDVLSTNFASFRDNDFVVDESIDPLISQNPFASRGSKWKVDRANMAPLFTTMKIKQVFPMIRQICDQLLTFISEHKTDVNAENICCRYTLEVVASCGLGVQAQTFSDDKSPFVTMTENIYSHGSLLKTTGVLFLPIISRILRIPYVPTKVDRWMRSMVADIRKMRDPSQRRLDLLQNLFELQEKRGDITENMLIGYCFTMILEGFETSSGLMSFSLFELAAHPDIQRAVQQEIEQVLQKFDGQITDEAVQEMHLLDAMCYEVTRLYAPMLVLTKVCNQRYELPPQNPSQSNSPVFVEPGTVVVIPVHSINLDPSYYKDPEVFDPNRFLGENKNQLNKYAYLGFGEGHRQCIGMKFAFAQGKAGLAAILSKYSIEFSAKQTLPLRMSKTSFLLSCESGIYVNFVDRKSV